MNEFPNLFDVPNLVGTSNGGQALRILNKGDDVSYVEDMSLNKMTQIISDMELI